MLIWVGPARDGGVAGAGREALEEGGGARAGAPGAPRGGEEAGPRRPGRGVPGGREEG